MGEYFDKSSHHSHLRAEGAEPPFALVLRPSSSHGERSMSAFRPLPSAPVDRTLFPASCADLRSYSTPEDS
eukprot:317304-Prymnesium_polylepis.1